MGRQPHMALTGARPHPEHHTEAVDVDPLVAARAHQQLRRGIRERSARRIARRQVARVHDACQAHVRCRSQYTLSAAGTV